MKRCTIRPEPVVGDRALETGILRSPQHQTIDHIEPPIVGTQTPRWAQSGAAQSARQWASPAHAGIWCLGTIITGTGRDAGSSRRQSQGIPEPPDRLPPIRATICPRIPSQHPPLPRANRGRCRPRRLRRERDVSANIIELLDDIVRCPAYPLLDDKVLRGPVDRAAEHPHRPHRERHDPQLHRPLGGQLDCCRNEAVDVGFAAVRGGQPAYRVGPQRVAAEAIATGTAAVCTSRSVTLPKTTRPSSPEDDDLTTTIRAL